MKMFVMGFFATFFLAGCATQNVAGTIAYRAVPQSQIVGALPNVLASEPSGTIVVKRDPGFMGKALSSILMLDGKQTANVKPGEFVRFRVKAGEHLFGVAWSDHFGKLSTASTRELAVDVQDGHTYYIRMFPLTGNGIAIERSSK